MFRLFNKFYAPDDAASSGSENGETETFELLNTDDSGPEEVLELPDKTGQGDRQDEESSDEGAGEETEDDELKEIEEELKGPSEDEEDLLELTTPVRRKEILAKYPKLFKDFPYLEKAYYREQQFTELYPTVKDAKQASEKAQILDGLDRDLMNGDITAVLKAAKDTDQESLNRIADNYLIALKTVDQQAYFNVLGNVIKDTIITMVREARNLGDSQGAPLQQAANILNQFVFGSQKFTPPSQLSRQVRPEEQTREQELNQREQARVQQEFESVRDGLQTKADNVLKSTIDGHIDPKGSMTDYVRTHAANEAFQDLENLIAKDTRFRSLLDKLWERAFQDKFSKESQDRIKSAYLSKAKTLLPSVIKKARNTALKGLARNSDERPVTKKAHLENQGNGRSASPTSSGRIRKPSDIPKGMSTLDVLMKD